MMQVIRSLDLDVWRCPHCQRILYKGHLAPGSLLEIKCGSCNQFTVIRT